MMGHKLLCPIQTQSHVIFLYHQEEMLQNEVQEGMTLKHRLVSDHFV
jgi:hypothetical protein